MTGSSTHRGLAINVAGRRGMSWYPSKRRSRTFPILLPTSGEWSFGVVSFFVGVRGLKRGDRLFGGGLALGTSLAAGLDALQDGLAVLVELQLGDDDVGGVDAQRDGLAGDLLAGDTLDVDHVLETVHGGDLALLVLVGAADDLDLVILADRDAADLFLTGEVSESGGGEGGRKAGCRLTLYFSRSSLLRGALMMLRRTLEGASKCALRDLRREEWTVRGRPLLVLWSSQWESHHAAACCCTRTGVDLGHFDGFLPRGLGVIWLTCRCRREEWGARKESRRNFELY